MKDHDGLKSISRIAAADSFYIHDFVKKNKDKDRIFHNLLQEVEFKQMFYFGKNGPDPIPRMVSAQTTKSNDVFPIYRMPGCNEANIETTHWTPTVEEIVSMASETINQPLNHCVCTLYRDENDSLAFHMDKLLDLDEDVPILSVSFGAARPIVFKSNDGKRKETIMLQSGSLMAIGPKTNRQFVHSIPKLDVETKPRISLSLRQISTYIKDSDTFEIIGKGSEHQCRNYPFIKSFRDPLAEYPTEVKEKMQQYEKESMVRLTILLNQNHNSSF